MCQFVCPNLAEDSAVNVA